MPAATRSHVISDERASLHHLDALCAAQFATPTITEEQPGASGHRMVDGNLWHIDLHPASLEQYGPMATFATPRPDIACAVRLAAQPLFCGATWITSRSVFLIFCSTSTPLKPSFPQKEHPAASINSLRVHYLVGFLFCTCR